MKSKYAFLKFDKALTPNDLIEQKLRELCVHKALFPTHKSAWFTYMNRLITECVTNEHPDTKVKQFQKVDRYCQEKVLKELHNQKEKKNIKMDYNMYEICYNENWRLLNPRYHDKNPSIEGFFDKDIQAMAGIGHIVHPSVSINGMTFRGNYQDPNNLFKAICKSIIGKPESCKNLNFKNKLTQDDEETVITYDDSNPRHQKVAKDKYDEYDKELVGMDKRARLAEIVLGLVIVCIINFMIITFCKIHNKKKSTD